MEVGARPPGTPPHSCQVAQLGRAYDIRDHWQEMTWRSRRIAEACKLNRQQTEVSYLN